MQLQVLHFLTEVVDAAWKEQSIATRVMISAPLLGAAKAAGTGGASKTATSAAAPSP